MHTLSQTRNEIFTKLKQEVQENALTLDEIKKHQANEHFDILVRDKSDTAVYWNTTTSLNKNRKVINGDTYTLTVLSKNVVAKKTRNLLCWMSVLLLFVTLLSGLFWIKQQGINSFTVHIATSVGLLLIGLLSVHYLEFPSWLQQSISDHRIISLLEFLLFMVWIGFNYTVILKWIKHQIRRRPMIYSAVAGFVISVGILFLAFIIKNSILHVIPVNGLDIPLQYTTQGVFLCFILIVFAIYTFYISLSSYELTDRKITQSKKYFSLGIGMLASIPLAFLLDLQLPILAVYAFIVSYLLILDIYTELDRKSAIFLFLWMIIFAGFMASLMFFYSYQKDVATRSEYAKTLYAPQKNDESRSVIELDSLMRESDIFTKIAQLPYPAKLDKKDFSAFVKRTFHSSLKDWNINLECFDNSGNTIFKDYYANVQTTQKKRGNAYHLRQYVYYNPFESHYYLNYSIENESFRSNPLQLNVELGKNLSPKHPQLDYFIFKNKQLLKANTTDYSYDPSLMGSITTEGIHDDYSYVIHKPTEDISIYVPRKMDGLIRPISLFSFLLTLMGILLLCFALVNSRYELLPQSIPLQFNYAASLRNRIQFTIISLTIFSFIFIGLMTILYFKNVLEQKEKSSTEQELRSIVNNIHSFVTSAEDDASMKNIVNNELNRIAQVHQKELSYYDVNAQLYNTSGTSPNDIRLPYRVWTKVTQSPSTIPSYIDHKQQQVAHYIPLMTPKNSMYGILSVSSPRSNLYSKSLLDFLSTILNVYIFLFLVAGAIAVATSNSITRPLASLSDKLKLFKLGKKHEPLVWDTKDEIGSLISNYNQLVNKLEESANIIARTERDTAWREMAKQVAHEIKNPLTPMKLSIQHLDRISQAEGVDVTRMVKRISATLLEQFNNLDQIANSFSNFATMPSASNEKIVVNEVVESIHDLFRKREDMEINLSEPITDLYIYADRNHLVRILNNIVKNAIQSIPTDRIGRVDISLEQKNNNAVIRVSDNGVGIPETMRDKVFTPNFTTKSSGTGLGLAISANMIEAFNGKIYFETELNVGTDFYIEIPLMRLEDNYKGQKRVSLD